MEELANIFNEGQMNEFIVPTSGTLIGFTYHGFNGATGDVDFKVVIINSSLDLLDNNKLYNHSS